MLILGGYNGEYLKSTEIFDPRSDRFVPAGNIYAVGPARSLP
ncbi:MAG: kelch repeat-containing protein [Chloroflexota bacterium]|nr:kelch repeat-containing protein [Chloroflexota bacterium]